MVSVEWCRWVGIKRIFHWDSVEGQFKCVKVCGDAEHYRTRADSRRLIERTVCSVTPFQTTFDALPQRMG
jgi:hypothetical protein